MSSDPIEVLRELAASWHRAALNCHECGKPSQARVFRECAAQVTSALASLSAPKPDGPLPDELVPHAKEWYRLCERSPHASRLSVSGELAEAIVETVVRLNSAPKPDGEWVLVPREPTTKMVDKAADATDPDCNATCAEIVEMWSAMLAAAPKPESAEAVIPWVREWKGSGPQRGFHIREATRLHNNRVVAYLGDQVDGDEVDKLIAEHNGKHPNGDPVRPAPPRPESVEAVGEVLRSEDGVARVAMFDDSLRPGAKVYTAPPRPEASAPVGDSLVQTALRNLPQYISKSGLVGPDKHSAMQCFEVLRDALAQQPAAVDEADTGYYLATFKQKAHGGFVLWWGPNNAGYTPDLEQAGVYTKLSPGYHDNEHTVPVPVSFIAGLRVRRVVDPGDTLNTMFCSAGELRAALAGPQQGGTPE